MRRGYFVVGALTGLTCAIALFLPPGQGAPFEEKTASLAPATYRMHGVVVANTCRSLPQPWPDEWTVTDRALLVGDYVLKARPQRAAVVYETWQHSADRCLTATWSAKLARYGLGLRGTATWEIRQGLGDGVECGAAESVPCMVEARVEGLPVQGENAHPDPAR